MVSVYHLPYIFKEKQTIVYEMVMGLQIRLQPLMKKLLLFCFLFTVSYQSVYITIIM